MQEFNENNMLTKFIKNLLETTFIPNIPIWKPNKPITKDLNYITKNYIIKAKKDWNPGKNEEGPKDALDENYFKVIDKYIIGKFYRGFTTNFISNTSNYDGKTHYYLGNYLRFIRDLEDIDLMQYYNCWGGVYSDRLRIKSTKDNTIEIIDDNNINDNIKVLIIPIKFNKKYTIFGNSNLPIEFCPIYFNGLNSYNLKSDDYKISIKDNYRKINYLSMYQPYVYDGIQNSTNTGINNNIINNENNLVLLMQLSENNASNIVILEGDYSDVHLINNNNFKNKLRNMIGDNFHSYPALIHTISNNSYPFSDRLIEYLLLNVITKNDQNTYNIKRVQKYNSSYKNLELNKMRYDMVKTNSIDGVWNNNLRNFNYDLVTNYPFNNLCLDINGYVDKDTEKIILRGKENNV